MANVLGWKDVLRPIRDGYRHLFPSPDTGPSPEERRKQRELDRLKGFAYFDTFQQLEAWTEAESDPIQRANTPLLERPQAEEDGQEKANVLLCHDYAGNYHDYEHVQGIGVDEEMYTCERLQFVDICIYFSHKLVCVPPPSWANTLHRNGVKALGTLLIEPQTKEVEKLLQHNDFDEGSNGNAIYPIARKLAEIAKHYNFDGWLINIEKPFPDKAWDSHLLEAFLRQLKSELGKNKQLVWYDALTTSNKVSYQNSLATSNLSFAKACGSILTNYCWKESHALSSRELALQAGFPPRNTFFGIDVWAQNTTKLTHPRGTYPEKGGGGTNTGIAVRKIAEVGLSVGIFAPAWSFEHFPGRGREVERTMWDGLSLPSDISCTCGNAAVRHLPNQEFPITRSANHFPAGSETFFYTDFKRGFGRHDEWEQALTYNGNKWHSQVSSQSILPHLIKQTCDAAHLESDLSILSPWLEDLVGHTQLVVDVHSIKSQKDTVDKRCLPLFKLDMPADGTLQLTVSFQAMLPAQTALMCFYLKFNNGVVTELFLTQSENFKKIEAPVRLGPYLSAENRLQEIGLRIRGPQTDQGIARALEIREICISPQSASSSLRAYTLDHIRIEHRGEGEMNHHRICWVFRDDNKRYPLPNLPYSDITGPFSHFVLRMNGTKLGNAYALEWILSKSVMEKLTGKEAEVVITGVGFNGQTLAEKCVRLRV